MSWGVILFAPSMYILRLDSGSQGAGATNGRRLKSRGPGRTVVPNGYDDDTHALGGLWLNSPSLPDSH